VPEGEGPRLSRQVPGETTAASSDGWESDWARGYHYALAVVGEGEYEAANQLSFGNF
jgi:hypothetical protein